MNQNKIFLKRKTESFDEYCHRISSMREEYDLNWTQVANIINENTGSDFTADKYRKQERRFLNQLIDNMDDEEIKEEYDLSPFDKESVTINYEKGETISSKEIPLTPDQLTNPSELLMAHGYNPDDWEIRTATNSKTSRMTPNGNTYVYASRITLKPKKSALTDVMEVAKYLEGFRAPKLPVIKKVKPTDEYLVVPLYDLHFGRFPDVEDFEKYDINEEKDRIINHVKKYIDKFSNRDFNKIYLIVGQDFLNSSFTGFTSSQSHLQSNAIDFRTMFRAGSELLISIIDMFAAKCNNLEVVGSLGNHDVSEEQMLFMLLKAYYRHESNIKVDDGFAPRKYREIGNATVGFGHLDKESKRAFGLMQIEAKDSWANTKSHVFIAGHLHHFSVDNENGVELYRIPAICPPDRWTRDNGYVMNEPKTMCFIFDKVDGLIETHFMYL